MNSCLRAIYSTTEKFPGDKSSGNDKLHCTANSTYLSSNSSLQPSFHLTVCSTSTGLNEIESLGQCVRVCVCVDTRLSDSFGSAPAHVIQCSYLGRRQRRGLKPLKTFQTLVPWWDHEKQLRLFSTASLSHHHDQVEKWDNGSGVKRHWVNSCVSVNSSQVFEGCSAPESEREAEQKTSRGVLDLCGWH